MLVKAGSGLAGEAVSDSAGVSNQQAQDTIVCPLDNDEELEMIFQNHGKEIAAVMIEPLPANYGLLVQRKEFIQKMAKLAKANGSLLIFDEVIFWFSGSPGWNGRSVKYQTGSRHLRQSDRWWFSGGCLWGP